MFFLFVFFFHVLPPRLALRMWPEKSVEDQSKPYYIIKRVSGDASTDDCCHFCVSCKIKWLWTVHADAYLNVVLAMRSCSMCVMRAVRARVQQRRETKKKKQTSPPPSSIQRAQQKKKEADPLCCRVSTRNNLPSGINMRKFIFILAASALLLRANAFQVCDFHWARLCAECTIRISDQVHRSQRCKTTLALPSLVFSIPKLKWIPFDNNNYIERIPINPNEPHEIVNLFFTFHIRGRQIRKLFI